jgi:L-ascorbate metabolism protein UlaG (beta-lactamase superfamily)
MRITFIGHAALLIEARGLTILSDPWWGHPCFAAQWWNFPRALGRLAEDRKLDYIYISHGHHDHLHPGTLAKLNRSAKVLVAAGGDLAAAAAECGFEAIEIGQDEERDLGQGVRCRIMRTHSDDSLMVVSDGEEVCVNLNDALHSAPADIQARFVARLRQLYPTIDYAFCGYGVASHFPNCYRIPGKNREATAAARQRYFNGQWAGLMASLAPRFALPFAADVVFLDDQLFWANEPTHNAERPLAALARMSPHFKGQAFDIAPGFAIERGKVVAAIERTPLNAEQLRTDMAQEIVKANRYNKADRETVAALEQLLAQNIDRCRAYLESYPDDYSMLVRFPGVAPGISIRKQGRSIATAVVDDANAVSADLSFTARAQYLRASLTRKYGNETLFVGSGCMFDYPNRQQAERNLQRELMVMVREHEVPPGPRRLPGPLAPLRKVVKRVLLGPAPTDLYDLGTWTTWQEASSENEPPGRPASTA